MIEMMSRRGVNRAWVLALVVCASAWPTLALAMDQCPPGTGASPWLMFGVWGSFLFALVMIVIRTSVLHNRPDHPRPRGQRLVMVLIFVSPIAGLVSLLYGIMKCVPQTQRPEVVCEHFAEEAEKSDVPVSFDEQVCVDNWRAEKDRLSWKEYRLLSSCAMRVGLRTMHKDFCAEEGFDPSRHAPGTWPPAEVFER